MVVPSFSALVDVTLELKNSVFVSYHVMRLVKPKPRDPKLKGIMERENKNIKTSYLLGRVFVFVDDHLKVDRFRQ